MNDAAAEGMNEFKKFELMEINSAHIEKDSLILEDIDQLEVSTKEGRPHQITAPILGLEIPNLKALNKATLQLWGVRFKKATEVEFNCRREVQDPDATILAADPVLAEVGGSSRGQVGQKRKLQK